MRFLKVSIFINDDKEHSYQHMAALAFFFIFNTILILLQLLNYYRWQTCLLLEYAIPFYVIGFYFLIYKHFKEEFTL